MTIIERYQIQSRLRADDRLAVEAAIESELRSAVYLAGLAYERAEGLGLLSGNGHHMAQTLAEEAVRRLRERFAAQHSRESAKA